MSLYNPSIGAVLRRKTDLAVRTSISGMGHAKAATSIAASQAGTPPFWDARDVGRSRGSSTIARRWISVRGSINPTNGLAHGDKAAPQQAAPLE